MKVTIVLLLFLMINLIGFSQTSSCANQLDSAEVIKIAKRHNAWWDIKPKKNLYSKKPKIVFDEQNCEWKVFSSKSKQTRIGLCDFSGKNCRDVGGCTVIKNVVLVIDDKTKKVKSKNKSKKKRYNLIQE
jgi:hypothetical protein